MLLDTHTHTNKRKMKERCSLLISKGVLHVGQDMSRCAVRRLWCPFFVGMSVLGRGERVVTWDQECVSVGRLMLLGVARSNPVTCSSNNMRGCLSFSTRLPRWLPLAIRPGGVGGGGSG